MDLEELQREFCEKIQRLQAEKEGVEAKLKMKRKQCEELETKLQKQTANAERDKAVYLKTQNQQDQFDKTLKSKDEQIF